MLRGSEPSTTSRRRASARWQDPNHVPLFPYPLISLIVSPFCEVARLQEQATQLESEIAQLAEGERHQALRQPYPYP